MMKRPKENKSMRREQNFEKNVFGGLNGTEREVVKARTERRRLFLKKLFIVEAICNVQNAKSVVGEYPSVAKSQNGASFCVVPRPRSMFGWEQLPSIAIFLCLFVLWVL
jgi:hypothetical protein